MPVTLRGPSNLNSQPVCLFRPEGVSYWLEAGQPKKKKKLGYIPGKVDCVLILHLTLNCSWQQTHRKICNIFNKTQLFVFLFFFFFLLQKNVPMFNQCNLGAECMQSYNHSLLELWD